MEQTEPAAARRSVLSRLRCIVERVASVTATSREYVIDVQRLRGRRVRVRLVADVIDEDEEVAVSAPFDPPLDSDAKGCRRRKARRTRRL